MSNLDAEILDEFKKETNGLLGELSTVVEKLEDLDAASDPFPKELLEEFAQKIDRIMGTSKTLETMEPGHPGFVLMSKLGELCKATGYKASGVKHVGLVPLFAAFWADTVETLLEVVDKIDQIEALQKINAQFPPVLQKRLTWLAKQVMAVAKDTPGEGQSQIQVDALLKSFGL